LDPTPDAYISMFGVTCYQQTKVRLNFYLCDFNYAPIPPNTPVTFYDSDPKIAGAKQIGTTFLVPDSIAGYCCGKVYTQILDVQYAGLNKLYAVVNDNGTAVPINLPNTSLVERDYTNNIASVSNFRFRVTISPAAPSVEPGDTLQLSAQTTPDPTGSSKFLWSPSLNMSCITCASPLYFADTVSITNKQVVATSQYQCFDTAYVAIKVPPYNDFTVTVNNITCAGKDSLLVDFTVKNSFKRGTIPKDLPVTFYKSDPTLAGAVVLAPVFITPALVNSKQQNYTCKIQKTGAGNIYASVNDNGTQIPVLFSNAPFAEKLYTNNITSYAYQPASKTIDTAVCNGAAVFGHTVAGTYVDTLVNANGCDTLRILNLTIKGIAVSKTTFTISICQGDTYAGYTTSGTYVDVFKAVNTCDSIRTLLLTVNPVVRQTKNIQICKGDSYFAAGKLQTQTGTYIDSAKTSLGCDSIVTTVLTVNSLPANFLPADTTMCIGRTLTITLNGYNTVTWSTGVPGNSIDITQPGSYSAQVIDRNGCAGNDVVNVLFDKCIPIQIPTAFTPNHDGKNDIFKPIIGALLTNYRMQIWNRWGQMIFETRTYNQGWNGTYQGQLQPNGTYIYFFSFTDPDGVETMKKGTLVLIR
jgi:gliding motility-associated-like protein